MILVCFLKDKEGTELGGYGGKEDLGGLGVGEKCNQNVLYENLKKIKTTNQTTNP